MLQRKIFLLVVLSFISGYFVSNLFQSGNVSFAQTMRNVIYDSLNDKVATLFNSYDALSGRVSSLESTTTGLDAKINTLTAGVKQLSDLSKKTLSAADASDSDANVSLSSLNQSVQSLQKSLEVLKQVQIQQQQALKQLSSSKK